MLVDSYFKRLNPEMPVIQADISGLADLASTYEVAGPELLRAAKALLTTNATIVEKKDELAGFLAGTAGFANHAAGFLEANQDRLIQLGQVQRPTLALLAKHSPIYPCFAQGLVDWLPRADGIFAGGRMHITLETAPQTQPYHPGEEPRWGDERGPDCKGLPDPKGGQANPRGGSKFDDGTDGAPTHAQSALPRAFLGSSGAAIPNADTGLAGTADEQAVVSALLTPGSTGDASLTTLLAGPILRGSVVSTNARPGPPQDGVTIHEDLSSLVKFLIFAAVTVLATGTLAATIANVQFGDRTTYKAMFTDVTGLSKGHEVRIAGVRVGTVDDIAVADDRNHAIVTFDVASTSVLTQGTVATIKYRNLVGERYIALTQGAGGAAPLTADATIPLERTHPALDLTVLFNGFKPLFAALSPKDVNELSGEIISVLQGEGGSINSLLAHTASLTSTLADRDQVIGRTIDNLTTVLDTVAANADSFGSLLDQLQRFVSGLAADRRAIGESLTNINSVTAELADLLHDDRPVIKEDIARLRTLTPTLNKPDNTKLFEQFIQRTPAKVRTITRTATYGSWFNFYLCRFDAKNIVLPTGDLPGGLGYDIAAARCAK